MVTAQGTFRLQQQQEMQMHQQVIKYLQLTVAEFQFGQIQLTKALSKCGKYNNNF
jgi:hypothetical protein